MCRLPSIVFVLFALAPAIFAAERFSGSTQLTANKTQLSADQRFALSAELQAPAATEKTTADQRFSVIADLAAPKSALTACGPLTDAVFKNGFEN